jgi:hypothetical protein
MSPLAGALVAEGTGAPRGSTREGETMNVLMVGLIAIGLYLIVMGWWIGQEKSKEYESPPSAGGSTREVD